MKKFLINSYRISVGIGNKLQSPFLLAVRLYWGWQFFLTGKGKLLGLEKVTEFFTSLGLPFPGANAVLAGSAECFGGLFLLLGLCSRPVSLILSFTMIVAYATADLDAVKVIFSDSDKFVSAAPFQFLFAAILVFIFGPGAISLDEVLRRKIFAKLPANG